MSAASVDGRAARKERTRVAVIEALLGLYTENNLTPTIDDIASRVGMTSRTIYHHFADHEAIAESLRHHQRPLMAPHMVAVVEGSLEDRIDELVAHRAALFELIAPVRRAALANMHRSARIRRGQAQIGRRLREQLADTFATELVTLDDEHRAGVIDLLDLHTSWETWDRLRRWQRLPQARARDIVAGLVGAALAQCAPNSEDHTHQQDRRAARRRR